MSLYSYHVFMFPFQWELKNGKEKAFSERFNLSNLRSSNGSQWENMAVPVGEDYQTELYNEKNFFYKFVHKALYDNGNEQHPVIRHYERKEAYNGGLEYEIGVKAKQENIYKLKVKSIGLDLFSTGTGIVIFYLENHNYQSLEDVIRINQFGRRIFPPFLTKDKGVEGTKDFELANYICINGLSGEPHRYYEDFSAYSIQQPWTEARFITSLIEDFNKAIDPEPVIDDRMFTMCWYLNNELGAEIKDERRYCKFVRSDKWHEFLYIDSDGSTCQNQRMQKELLQQHTYPRWQKQGTLYGITRHSFMAISFEGWFPENILLSYFRTIYVRIAELVLLQRASVLKFSSEVTRLSTLEDKKKQTLADEIDKFYKAYIRFVNQIYFREITTQEQGIDLYDRLMDSMRIKDQVKDLDNEIEELHNYATLLDDKAQSNSLSLLTVLGSLFLAPSFIVGFFGMNLIPEDIDKTKMLWIIISVVILIASGLIGIVWFNKNGKKKASYFLIGFISLLAIMAMLFSLIHL